MRRACVAVLLASLAAGGVGAQDAFDPDAVDLAGLIACESGIPDYSNLAFALSMEPDAVDRLGWREVDAGNPFLRQFELPSSFEVFGHSTSQIVFSATGVLAILRDVDASELGRQLGTTQVAAAPGQMLSEKVIFEAVEEDDEAGMTFDTKISLNMSTIDTHPGAVLAGCSYRIEIR